MSGGKETEGKLASNPISLEMAKIAKLDPNVVLIGLNHLLLQRAMSLMDKEPKPQSEEEWQMWAYGAVISLFSVDEHPEYSDGGEVYLGIVTRTRNYMKFLGFEDVQISSLGIVAAYEDSCEEVAEIINGSSNIISLEARLDDSPQGIYERAKLEQNRYYRQEVARNERLRARNNELQAQLDRLLDIDITRYDINMLKLMDRLMEYHDTFPTRAEFNKEQSQFEKTLSRMLNDEKPRRKKTKKSSL